MVNTINSIMSIFREGPPDIRLSFQGELIFIIIRPESLFSYSWLQTTATINAKRIMKERRVKWKTNSFNNNMRNSRRGKKS